VLAYPKHQETELDKSMHRQEIQRCDRLELERWQLERLNALLETVLPDNRYYRDLFGCDRLAIRSLADWSRMPT